MTKNNYTEPKCLFGCCNHLKLEYDSTTRKNKYICEAWDDKNFHNNCPYFQLKATENKNNMLTWDYQCDLTNKDQIVSTSSYHMKNIVAIPTWQVIETLVDLARQYPDASATQIVGQAVKDITNLASKTIQNME